MRLYPQPHLSLSEEFSASLNQQGLEGLFPWCLEVKGRAVQTGVMKSVLGCGSQVSVSPLDCLEASKHFWLFLCWGVGSFISAPPSCPRCQCLGVPLGQGELWALHCLSSAREVGREGEEEREEGGQRSVHRKAVCFVGLWPLRSPNSSCLQECWNLRLELDLSRGWGRRVWLGRVPSFLLRKCSQIHRGLRSTGVGRTDGRQRPGRWSQHG